MDMSLYLKDRLGKIQTVNSYQFKVSPIIKFGIHERIYQLDNITFTHLVEQEHVIKEIYTKEELKLCSSVPKSGSFAEFLALLG